MADPDQQSCPTLRARRIAGALGAEIVGVDLSQDLAEDTVAAIRQALLDHLVIFFRDQALSPDRFLALARRFGEPAEYPFVRGMDEHPEIIRVAKLEHETVNFGGLWHSDTAYLEQPPMGSMLLASELPPVGGDTLFANQVLAYERLSPGMRRMLDGLRAVNASGNAAVVRTRQDRIRDSGRAALAEDAAARHYVAEHPVVRTHPETGRRALYVNSAHTRHFAGMTEAESRPLLEFLFQHQTRPEFTCRFVWSPHALAFWDNRATLHNPINDYHGHRRVALRITLAGDRPR